MEDGHTLHIIDYLIIAFSLGDFCCHGISALPKDRSTTRNFFHRRRQDTRLGCGISIMATLINSVTFLAYPGEGYSSNWIRLVQGTNGTLSSGHHYMVCGSPFRESDSGSTYEYFEKRFGFFARLYTSLAFLLTHFTKNGDSLFPPFGSSWLKWWG
ncbi:MAG: hypothetical protein MZV63_58175 [Marinilabiliales bacterium]|nr:hypothetical protein [Marinilabiliales bacterium]